MLSFDEVASFSGKALGLPSISKLAKPLVVCGNPGENETVKKLWFPIWKYIGFVLIAMIITAHFLLAPIKRWFLWANIFPKESKKHPIKLQRERGRIQDTTFNILEASPRKELGVTSSPGGLLNMDQFPAGIILPPLDRLLPVKYVWSPAAAAGELIRSRAWLSLRKHMPVSLSRQTP